MSTLHYTFHNITHSFHLLVDRRRQMYVKGIGFVYLHFSLKWHQQIHICCSCCFNLIVLFKTTLSTRIFVFRCIFNMLHEGTSAKSHKSFIWWLLFFDVIVWNRLAVLRNLENLDVKCFHFVFYLNLCCLESTLSLKDLG